MFQSQRYGLCAAADSKFAQDIANVKFNGGLADE
jgi:hypothetical protein